MRKYLFIAIWMMACVPLWAQTSHRDSLLAEARYLKSIFRTDDAIEKLSDLVQPEAMDEVVLAELADCHFQSGDFEGNCVAGPLQGVIISAWLVWERPFPSITARMKLE